MIATKPYKILAAALLASLAWFSGAMAGDQAKTIVNALDPKSMNELFEVSKRQPDAALTNIMPLSPNTFRFLFVWPASNPIMTYERVGQSFAERFATFAEKLKSLATGFCLISQNMYFGTAPYGEEEVNVAYRDIEVRYPFSGPAPCPGRYVSIAEAEQVAPVRSFGYGAALPRSREIPPEPPANPEDNLKPFVNPSPAPPAE